MIVSAPRAGIVESVVSGRCSRILVVTHQQGENTTGDQARGQTDGEPTRDDVMEALENVIDPELGLDFVSLGLVYDVEIEAGEVYVTFTLTSPGCPIGPQVSEQMKEFVGELDGVDNVYPKMTFSPPWSPDNMSDDAKFALGF
jgi:metal-sulfur cluster biosynthetic enzyme